MYQNVLYIQQRTTVDKITWNDPRSLVVYNFINYCLIVFSKSLFYHFYLLVLSDLVKICEYNFNTAVIYNHYKSSHLLVQQMQLDIKLQNLPENIDIYYKYLKKYNKDNLPLVGCEGLCLRSKEFITLP